MGMRFRKSVKIAPGIKLNIGKKSAGVSIGGKYGGISLNSRTGAHARVSAPGTGISYATKISTNQKENKTFTPQVTDTSSKSKWIAFILCFFFGYLGLHKFYVNHIGQGILYLFTCGLFFVGWLTDIIKILANKYKDEESKVLR